MSGPVESWPVAVAPHSLRVESSVSLVRFRLTLKTINALEKMPELASNSYESLGPLAIHKFSTQPVSLGRPNRPIPVPGQR